ncbi:MAG: response regulator transcription factor [Bacteroidetes bacterium]|nr:response regulator transcription factor [Bacteroidota bacterium]MBK8367810.1 response regulator transcription factor [Bacteroidota bacterium]
MNAIIIDDEERARNTLSSLLLNYCPEINVLATCSNVPDGVLAINKHKPDVVFLDIEMPDYNGFELLGFFREIDFDIIFVTAYSEYAIKAFEISAVDYILKPIDIDQLKNSVEKLKQKKLHSQMQEQIELLKESYKGDDIRKIALSMSNGLTFVEVADIVLLEADGAYTTFYLKDGQKILVSKKLKFYEDILSNRSFFFRTHRSYFINVNFIKKYSRSENAILMDNGTSINISRDRKQEFETLLKELRVSI